MKKKMNRKINMGANDKLLIGIGVIALLFIGMYFMSSKPAMPDMPGSEGPFGQATHAIADTSGFYRYSGLQSYLSDSAQPSTMGQKFRLSNVRLPVHPNLPALLGIRVESDLIAPFGLLVKGNYEFAVFKFNDNPNEWIEDAAFAELLFETAYQEGMEILVYACNKKTIGWDCNDGRWQRMPFNLYKADCLPGDEPFCAHDGSAIHSCGQDLRYEYEVCTEGFICDKETLSCVEKMPDIPVLPPITVQGCIDTDGGINIGDAGAVKAYDLAGYDFDDGDSVVEYICKQDDNLVFHNQYWGDSGFFINYMGHEVKVDAVNTEIATFIIGAEGKRISLGETKEFGNGIFIEVVELPAEGGVKFLVGNKWIDMLQLYCPHGTPNNGECPQGNIVGKSDDQSLYIDFSQGVDYAPLQNADSVVEFDNDANKFYALSKGAVLMNSIDAVGPASATTCDEILSHPNAPGTVGIPLVEGRSFCFLTKEGQIGRLYVRYVRNGEANIEWDYIDTMQIFGCEQYDSGIGLLRGNNLIKIHSNRCQSDDSFVSYECDEFKKFISNAVTCNCQNNECVEEVCTEVWDPVCGSDGTTYENDCWARKSGVDWIWGECTSLCEEGDIVKITNGVNDLELEEGLFEVRDVLTELDTSILRGGVITTKEGSTDYNQYLRFQEEQGIDGFSNSLRVVYGREEFYDSNRVDEYLISPGGIGNVMFEWEIEFEEGAESQIYDVTELDDLEGIYINILGQKFVIYDTDINVDNSEITLKFLGNPIEVSLRQAELHTVDYYGKQYEIIPVIISGGLEPEVKFEINGQPTDVLREGETDIFIDGLRIAIDEIVPNSAGIDGGGLVDFYLSNRELEFTDRYDDQDFVRNVEVNDESIEDGLVSIRGRLFSNNQKFELLTMKYRLEADTFVGDLYVSKGHGIQEYLDEPEGMLSNRWDIFYNGLSDPGFSILKFDMIGNDEYDLRFTSAQNFNYNVEFIDDDADFRVGDNDDNLIWIEADNAEQYIIPPKSQIVLVDEINDVGFTRIVEYVQYNSNNLSSEVTFLDLTGRQWIIPTTPVGSNARKGVLEIAPMGRYEFYVDTTQGAGYKISMDLNNDGVIGDGDGVNDDCSNRGHDQYLGLSIGAGGFTLDPTVPVVEQNVGPCRSAIVVDGGGILDLGVCDGNNPPGSATCTATESGGVFAGEIGQSNDVLMGVGLKTLNENFDQDGPRNQGGDEVTIIEFFSKSGYGLGLDVVTEAPPGRGSDFNLELKELNNNDFEREMTHYGTLMELYTGGAESTEDLTIEYPLQQLVADVYVLPMGVSVDNCPKQLIQGASAQRTRLQEKLGN